MKTTIWRPLLAALPLPMLALAASYGVYSFALLFVPLWVAVVQAAAFEITYIGLAVIRTLDTRQRRRAGLISVGAVLASIVYNTLAGWFHRQPELLAAATPLGWLFLAALHGAPLAWVAYLVADLLLHQEPAAAPLWGGSVLVSAPREQERYPSPVPVAMPTRRDAANAAPASINAVPQVCPGCGTELDPARWRAARRWGHCATCKEPRP